MYFKIFNFFNKIKEQHDRLSHNTSITFG